MALVKCPECGREKVSDSAIACPDCGFGIKEYFNSTNNQSAANLLQIDNTKYSLVVAGFCDTDTAAYAGISEIMGMDISYDEAMDIFSNCPYILSQYDLKSEAVHLAKQFERWGIEVYVICPDGTRETFGLEGLSRKHVISNTNTNKTEELIVDNTLKGLSFLIPIVGLIIYCINVSKSPKGAKECLKYAIAGILGELTVIFLCSQRL